jgi:hypothetical protein
MPIKKTISTHNGGQGQANRAHNNRTDYVVKQQEHIAPTLSQYNEYIIDIPPREAYTQIFGAALKEYNTKQTRLERKIDDYYNHVRKDKKKNAVYEIIIQVGDNEDTGVDFHSTKTERKIIKEFIENWQERNPHLKLIGAYLHADEPSGTLHAHLNYIPVATGYKRGLKTQNGLNKALSMQGFTEKQGKDTPQIQWERRENTALETICNKYSIEVHRPKSKLPHLDTLDYKKQKKQEEIDNLEQKHEKLRKEHINCYHEHAELQQQCKNLTNEKDELKIELSYYHGLYTDVEKVDTDEKKLPFGKTAVNTKEYETIKNQARAYRANRDEIKKIRKDKEEIAQQKEYLTSKLKEIHQKEKSLDELITQADDKYILQINLNMAYESLTEDYNEEKETTTLLHKENADLRAKTTSQGKIITSLEQALTNVSEALKNTMQAIGLFKYSKNKDYRIEKMTSKQELLINGLSNYVRNWLIKFNHKEFADEISKSIGIDEEIQKCIDKIKIAEQEKDYDCGFSR